MRKADILQEVMEAVCIAIKIFILSHRIDTMWALTRENSLRGLCKPLFFGGFDYVDVVDKSEYASFEE